MKILKITLACTNIEKMTGFYSKIFEVNFGAHEFPGFKMYSAKIGDVNFLFCPNEIAGVNAEQNRHQLDYECSDINLVIKNALEAHGEIHTALQENNNEFFVTILDPDGNTINFIQKK